MAVFAVTEGHSFQRLVSGLYEARAEDGHGE